MKNKIHSKVVINGKEYVETEYKEIEIQGITLTANELIPLSFLYLKELKGGARKW